MPYHQLPRCWDDHQSTLAGSVTSLPPDNRQPVIIVSAHLFRDV
jgi:hypothetical protein